MSDNLIEFSPSAYQYPLLGQEHTLLGSPLGHSPEQEMVYGDLRRHTYRTFRERVGHLASGLSQISVKQGDLSRCWIGTATAIMSVISRYQWWERCCRRSISRLRPSNSYSC